MSEFPDLKVFARSVKPHGWRKELLVPSVELETKLTMLSCFICKSVLMKAVMASCCGSRFCEECIEFSQRSGISACPKCGEELETYTDSRVRKMIDQLQAYCINKPECAEQGKIGDLINHVVQCPYGVGDCPFGCDEAMLRKDFSAHERVCEKKLLPCKYCKVKVHESLQAEHWERSCTKRPLKCKYCGTELSRNKLTEHVLAKHKAEYEKEYVQLNEEFKRSYETHKTALEKLSQISQSELDVAFSELQQRLMYAGASGPFKDMIEASLAATSDRTELTKVMDLLKDEDTREIQKLDTYIHDFEQRIAAVKLHLDRSFQKLLENDESTGDEKLVDGLKSDIEQTKKQLIVQTDFFDAVEKDVQFLEVSSKDGVFVWKLEKWTEVLHKAKNGDQACIYSPTFYSSPAGYRMRLRMFPNGDRDQHNRGISLYLMLMRGPYDPVLRWPFDKQVLVTILDQSNYPMPVQPVPGAPPPSPPERADYTCVIRPDLSKSAQLDACRMPRPDRDSNASIGFVKYIDHSELDNPGIRTINAPQIDPSRPIQQMQVSPKYIRDDCVFIRVVVEPLERST